MEHGAVYLLSALFSLPPVTYRQSHDHPRPSGFRPLQADLAAVVLEHALDDREPQPRAAALGRIKRLEDLVPVLVGDAGPRVLDDDIEPSAPAGRAGDYPERPSSAPTASRSGASACQAMTFTLTLVRFRRMGLAAFRISDAT